MDTGRPVLIFFSIRNDLLSEQKQDRKNRVWTVWKRSDVSGTNGLDGLDGLETVWCVWNHARSFGNSILIIFLFLKISIGRLLPELVFRGWKSGLDGLETVWGVWNQAKISGNSILNTFLFWKMSIRRRVPELVSDRTKKQLIKGGGGGGPFFYCKKIHLGEQFFKVKSETSVKYFNPSTLWRLAQGNRERGPGTLHRSNGTSGASLLWKICF